MHVKYSKKQTSRSQKCAVRDQRGIAATEAALLFPLFLFIILGVLEFSMLMLRWVTAEYATVQVARELSTNFNNFNIDTEAAKYSVGLIDYTNTANCACIRAFTSVTQLRAAPPLTSCGACRKQLGSAKSYTLIEILFRYDFATPLGVLIKYFNKSITGRPLASITVRAHTVLNNEYAAPPAAPPAL